MVIHRVASEWMGLDYLPGLGHNTTRVAPPTTEANKIAIRAHGIS